MELLQTRFWLVSQDNRCQLHPHSKVKCKTSCRTCKVFQKLGFQLSTKNQDENKLERNFSTQLLMSSESYTPHPGDQVDVTWFSLQA